MVSVNKQQKAKTSKVPGWLCLKTQVLFRHSRITLVEDLVRLPGGELIKYLRFVNSGGGVSIICIDKDRILLQKEYSYPVNKSIYQFPGGKVEKNEKPIEAARRELLEESGVNCKKIKQIGWYYPNNRRTDAKMYVFSARNISQTKEYSPDKEEKIDSEWISINEFKKMIKKGKINNYSVLAAWSLFSK